jgi:hypothetical protein
MSGQDQGAGGKPVHRVVPVDVPQYTIANTTKMVDLFPACALTWHPFPFSGFHLHQAGDLTSFL